MRGFASRLAAAMLVLAAVSLVPVHAREFRVADTQPADYPTVKALELMGRLIAERSGGRHSLRIFHSRQLGEEKETIEQTRIGAIDINRTNVAPLASFIPEANILALPSSSARWSISMPCWTAGRRRHPRELRALRPRRSRLLRFRRALHLQFRSPHPHRRGSEGPAHPRPAVRHDGGDDAGARRRACGAALWPGDGEPHHRPHPRRREQLAVLCDDRPFPRRPSHHPHRAHDEPEVLVVSKKAWEELAPDEQAIFRAAARESALAMRASGRSSRRPPAATPKRRESPSCRSPTARASRRRCVPSSSAMRANPPSRRWSSASARPADGRRRRDSAGKAGGRSISGRLDWASEQFRRIPCAGASPPSSS